MIREKYATYDNIIEYCDNFITCDKLTLNAEMVYIHNYVFSSV